MKYVLGIDQGNSGTRALLSDFDGLLLGYGNAFGAQHTFDGMERAMKAVKEAAQIAIIQAGVINPDIAVIYGGFTGADWADEYLALQENVRALGFSDVVYIVNDCIVALRGGTDHSYGVIIIAGSGGNVAIRSPEGKEFIYGYFHEDNLQGGSSLGYHVLRAIYRAETGREPSTSLTSRVLARYQLDTVEQLLRANVENRLPGECKDLAPILFEEADQGDVVARRIVQYFGEGNAEMAVAGLRRLGMLDLEVEVVLSGNIFKAKGPLLIDTITNAIRRDAPRARIVNARYEPVVGGVLLGLEKAGVDINTRVKENVGISARKLGLIRV
jgi:N-acetylglucosamine kinase-like BadF-type ATPase